VCIEAASQLDKLAHFGWPSPHHRPCLRGLRSSHSETNIGRERHAERGEGGKASGARERTRVPPRTTTMHDGGADPCAALEQHPVLSNRAMVPYGVLSSVNARML
jgi:hypothetical protein